MREGEGESRGIERGREGEREQGERERKGGRERAGGEREQRGELYKDEGKECVSVSVSEGGWVCACVLQNTPQFVRVKGKVKD